MSSTTAEFGPRPNLVAKSERELAVLGGGFSGIAQESGLQWWFSLVAVQALSDLPSFWARLTFSKLHCTSGMNDGRAETAKSSLVDGGHYAYILVVAGNETAGAQYSTSLPDIVHWSGKRNTTFSTTSYYQELSESTYVGRHAIIS
jgi:hypothetical protein